MCNLYVSLFQHTVGCGEIWLGLGGGAGLAEGLGKGKDSGGGNNELPGALGGGATGALGLPPVAEPQP